MSRKRNNQRKQALATRLANRHARIEAFESTDCESQPAGSPELDSKTKLEAAVEPNAAPELAHSSQANDAPSEPATPPKPDAETPPARAPKAPAATSEATRKCMQGNKRANTKPELLVRQRLREAGLTGYRLQWKVPGRPDVAWPGKKVAIMVNGCFWHRCPHCALPLPKSNVEYWVVKFENNVKRDKKNLALLEEDGWKVHVIWECQLKKKTIDRTFEELLPQLAEELGKELTHAND